MDVVNNNMEAELAVQTINWYYSWRQKHAKNIYLVLLYSHHTNETTWIQSFLWLTPNSNPNI